MAFNIDDLFPICVDTIEQFALEHQAETFYAFAVDASLLCMNSEEAFEETVRRYQSDWDRRTRVIASLSEMTEKDHWEAKWLLSAAEKRNGLDRSDEGAVLRLINEDRSTRRDRGCHYRTEDGMSGLKENTGDWTYQGFADMTPMQGFDFRLYDDHYNEAMNTEHGHAPNTEYAVAMTELCSRLRESGVFARFRTTEGFTVDWVEHDY